MCEVLGKVGLWQRELEPSLRLHHSKEPELPDLLFSLDTSNLAFQGKTLDS